MKRSELSAERKNQILDTAAAVFAQRGFHQARVDDIVRESGLSKGAIYWYFKSKDEIVRALMQRFFDQEMQDLQALLQQEGSVSERLLVYVRRVAADVQHIEATGLMPLFYDFYTLAIRQEDIRQFLQSYFETFRAALVPLIEQGIARGELRPVDAQAAAVSLGALYEGLILLRTIDPQRVPLAEQMESATRLLLEGLQAR